MEGQMPSCTEIALAQKEIIAGLPWCSSQDAARRCWACGFTHETFLPQRAHIVARANGGDTSPSNFFLLCWRCHKAQPDSATRETQLQWLRSQRWYIEVQAERAWPVVEVLRDAARELDAAPLLVEFAKHDLGRIMAEHACGSAGASMNTAEANALWGLVDAFRGYVARKRIA